MSRMRCDWTTALGRGSLMHAGSKRVSCKRQENDPRQLENTRCGMAWQLLTRHHTATAILHLLAPVVRRNYHTSRSLPAGKRELLRIVSFVTRCCSQPLWLFPDISPPLLHAVCHYCRSHATRIPRFFSPFHAGRTGTIASEMRCAISRPGRIFTCDRFSGRARAARWIFRR